MMLWPAQICRTPRLCPTLVTSPLHFERRFNAPGTGAINPMETRYMLLGTGETLAECTLI